MRRYITIAALAAALCLSAVSCNKDAIDYSRSVITGNMTETGSFDEWLHVNYVVPYNIRFLYKMKDIESDISYTLSPADYKKSTQMARIVKHLCLEAYDEVTGSRDFVCMYFPKMFHLIGSAAYNPNQTIMLGTAEGGMKITLYMVNDINVGDIRMLNEYYFHTIHHEFAHILHQTKNYPIEYKDLSGTSYVQDSWLYNLEYLEQGFVTAYSSKEPNEDFVEVISTYVTTSPEEWDSLLEKAGEKGGKIIREKIAICKNYMLTDWDIDLDNLRDIIARRSSELNLLNLDVEL